MSGREELAAVIVTHQRIPLWKGDGQTCSAGCPDLLGEPDGPNSPRHAEHVADAVLAWLADRLADEGMREAVAEAIDDSYDWIIPEQAADRALATVRQRLIGDAS